MRTGNRWLIAGVTTALLVAVSPAGAQVPGGPDGGAGPVVGGAGPGRNSGPAGSFQPPAPIRPNQALSVLVFPFGFAAGDPAATPAPAPEAPAGTDPGAAAPQLSAAQQETASYVTAAVKAGLLSSPFYSVATYHPQSSLVQRGRKDDILRPEHLTDVISPATAAVDAEKARTIAYRLGLQAYMIGTLESKEDPMTNTVEVTLETQVVDSTNGQVIRSAAVTGAAVGAEGVPLQAVRERASLDAAQKALPALGIQLVPITQAPVASGKGGNKAKGTGASKSAPKTPVSAEQKKADREAKKAADEAREKAERDERDRKRAAEKARRDAGKARKAAEKTNGKNTTPTAEPGAAPAAAVQQDQAPATPGPGAGTPAPANPGAGTPATVTPTVTAAGPNTVPGYTNSSGQPLPYGYAVGDGTKPLRARNKGGLRVPAWLGVAGFLTGISFLL